MKRLDFGAVYVIERDYSDDEIRRDLHNMKNDGYNLITLWPIANPWLTDKPDEFIYDRTRFVLDVCNELGIKAIMQLFGQNQAQEGVPDCLLPVDAETVSSEGNGLSPNVYWSNMNHPHIQKLFDDYFRSAITALKDHPAVFGWDVFNEAHFKSDDEWTIKCYRKWLKKKYGTIEALNYAWYRRYSSFDEISAENRNAGYSIWSSLLPSYDFEKFRSENLTDICQFLYDTAKKYDSIHPIIIDGTSSQIIQKYMVYYNPYDVSITQRNNDEFDTAHIPDVYGSTFYPKSWGRDYRNTPWILSEYFSIPAGAARKAHKPYAVNELQTHTQAAMTPGSEVSPSEIRHWIGMNLFTAPRMMQLWRWRPFLHGYQITGRGLTRFDGTPNERSVAVKDLLSVIYSHDEVFSSFQIRKPSVRIATSYGKRLAFDCMLKWVDSFWPDDVEGWYKLFWNIGANPEFTDIEHLDDEDFSADIIVIPATMSINKEEIQRLREYTEKGGILVADSRLGTSNEYIEAPKEGIPGHELSSLFGFIEEDVGAGGTYTFGGEVISLSKMHQKLRIVDEANTEVLAYTSEGSPAVIRHKCGNGAAIYFNSFAGTVFKDSMPMSVESYFRDELKGKGQMVAEKGACTHLAYIVSESKSAMLAINFSSEPDSVVVRNFKATDVTEIISGRKCSSDGQAFRTVLPPDSCSVFVW